MKKSSDFVWIKRGWWRYIGTEATEDAHSTGAVDYMEPEAVPAETETSPAIEDTTAADHTGLESGPAEAEAPETADGTGAADYMEPEAAEPPAPPKTMLWLRGPVQYGGTNSLGDKLQVIAQHTADRTVDPQAVSQRLLLDGQSTARPRNLERVVRRTLRDAPEFHELSLSTEPTDWYQYRPMEARHSCLNDEAYSNKLIYRTGKPEESTFHEEPTYDRIERTGIPAW